MDGVTVSVLGALAALVVAIVLILKKVQPTYAMLIGAVAGGLIGGAGLTGTVNYIISGTQGIVSAIIRIVTAGGRSRPHLSLENDRVLPELLRFALCVRGEADRAVQRAEQQHEHHRRDQDLDHGFSPAVTQHLYQFFHSAAPPAGLLTGSYFL